MAGGKKVITLLVLREGVAKDKDDKEEEQPDEQEDALNSPPSLDDGSGPSRDGEVASCKAADKIEGPLVEARPQGADEGPGCDARTNRNDQVGPP